jgi:carboxyl-terminal processing protease
VVGTKTFGKGVFQKVKQLSNGGALDITVGEYFLPSGRNLGGGGVRRGAGRQAGRRSLRQAGTRRDEALERALDVVRSAART